MACTSNNNIPVRLINLSDSPKIIKKGACLGSVNWISADCNIVQLDADETQIRPTTESSIINNQIDIDNNTQTTTTSTDIHDNKSYGTDHLNEIDWSASLLTEQQRKELTQLLIEYKDVFSTGPYDIGVTDVVTHKIITEPGKGPINSRPYRTTPHEKNIIQQQIDELLKAII